jgi:hypothetical protein
VLHPGLITDTPQTRTPSRTHSHFKMPCVPFKFRHILDSVLFHAHLDTPRTPCCSVHIWTPLRLCAPSGQLLADAFEVANFVVDNQFKYQLGLTLFLFWPHSKFPSLVSPILSELRPLLVQAGTPLSLLLQIGHGTQVGTTPLS